MSRLLITGLSGTLAPHLAAQAKAQELTRAGVPAQEVLAQVIRAGYGL